jgi:preprotein translocase subunit SecG
MAALLTLALVVALSLAMVVLMARRASRRAVAVHAMSRRHRLHGRRPPRP